MFETTKFTKFTEVIVSEVSTHFWMSEVTGFDFTFRILTFLFHMHVPAMFFKLTKSIFKKYFVEPYLKNNFRV